MGASHSGDYSWYVDIVTKRYFDAVDKYNMQDVLDCFTEDATLTIQTVPVVNRGREKGLKAMYQRLFDDHEYMWHGNFVHTVDVERNAITSQFVVLIKPNGQPMLRYENCNVFFLKDRLFSEVHVYMSGENLLREGNVE